MTTSVCEKTEFLTAGEIAWENVPCNLCGRDETMIYHRERLPYFGRELDFQIVKCRHCGLVYTNPRLTEHNATYLRASDDNPAVIESHGQAKKCVFDGALNEIAKLRNSGESVTCGKLLDIGCGSGHFLHAARGRSFEVTGIEPARVPADYAINKFSVPVINTDVLNVDLPENSFDVITAWDVIEHVSDPNAVLRQCVSWLKPGGIMALRFPSATWQKIKGVLFHQLLASSHAAFGPTMHLYFFNEDTFSRMAQQVGLEVLQVKTTPTETNAQGPLLNALKVISGIVVRSCEVISGKNIGNLEVYCRKE
jgi:2-polyprenyl-3-methyl-5-hydroxy-6-metoxy-1,4-benzoquinol methylase